MRGRILRLLVLPALIALAAASRVAVPQAPTAAVQRPAPAAIAPAEFAKLIGEISEEGGYFSSDNFTSNETSYLHVVDTMRTLNVRGGAYIGVGPEQNFTYISKVRPEIAFIVDIRRQAVLQHLIYKAAFRASQNRAEFLANLLSRPLAGENAPGGEATGEMLIEYFRGAPAASDEAFASSLARIRSAIEKDFLVPLSKSDQERLEYVFTAFRKEGLGISFRIGASSWGGGYGSFPSLADLITQRDLHGNPGHFLASEEDYAFVRQMHAANRIIPVVGDFAGTKALAAVGDYLRGNGYTVRAFYASNVEQFLFRNGVYAAFAANLRRLPVDNDSVIIRAVPARGQYHPAYVPGHRITTVLQRIPVLLRDYGDGATADYWQLVTTNYLADRAP